MNTSPPDHQPDPTPDAPGRKPPDPVIVALGGYSLSIAVGSPGALVSLYKGDVLIGRVDDLFGTPSVTLAGNGTDHRLLRPSVNRLTIEALLDNEPVQRVALALEERSVFPEDERRDYTDPNTN